MSTNRNGTTRPSGRHRGAPPDWLRLLNELEDSPDKSLHSFDIREHLRIGNPSERIRDIRKRGWRVDAEREGRGDRTGTRYTLVGRSKRAPRPRPTGSSSPGARAGRGLKLVEVVWDYTDGGPATVTEIRR